MNRLLSKRQSYLSRLDNVEREIAHCHREHEKQLEDIKKYSASDFQKFRMKRQVNASFEQNLEILEKKLDSVNYSAGKIPHMVFFLGTYAENFCGTIQTENHTALNLEDDDCADYYYSYYDSNVSCIMRKTSQEPKRKFFNNEIDFSRFFSREFLSSSFDEHMMTKLFVEKVDSYIKKVTDNHRFSSWSDVMRFVKDDIKTFSPEEFNDVKKERQDFSVQ
jgi:hypothetical protein